MRVLFFVLLFMPLSIVNAQTVSIRAGEHANFSRLVLTIPVGSGWDVGRIEGGFGVSVENVETFNYDAVFDRIPRDRILDLALLKSKIALSIVANCECYASAFLWQPDKLVVDIRDGGAPTASPSNDPFDVPVQFTVLPVLTEQRPIERLVPDLTPLEPVAQNQLDALEEIITAGIGRAAAQGLLEPSKVISSVQPTQIDAHILQNSPGILAHTSFDRQVEEISGPECFADELFDVPSWGNADVPFHQHIAQLRSAVVGEFDRPDPQAVEQLAKGFLYYGFGREARNALTIDEEKSTGRSILIALATVMDGDFLEMPLAQDPDCSGVASLWTFLSNAEPAVYQFDRKVVLRSFRALPVHLQTHLGPTLSEKFLEIGDLEGAEIALNSSEFTSDKTIETKLAETGLQVAQGDIVEVTETLAVLAATDVRLTPKALTDYFTMAVQSSISIDPEALALADIFRFEQRGSPQTGNLVAAQIEALVASGNVPRALDILDEEAAVLGDDRYEILQSAALIAASKTYDDLAFIELAFEDDTVLASSDVQNKIAERLIELGFPQRAGVLVAGSAVGSAMIDRRYLRAEAALARGDANATLVHLLGQTSDRANTLRVFADLLLEGRGDILGELGPTDWRLGNWASMSQGEDVLLQDISISVLDDATASLDRTAPLAQGRDLLAQSVKTRALLNDVLMRFAPVEN